MLTGKRAFIGESISDTLAAVIRAEPDWASLRADTPPAIRTLLRRCLQKDQRQRLQAIGEARIAIEEVLFGSPTAEAALGAVPTQLSWRQAMRWAWFALALVLGAISAGFIAWYLRPAPERRSVSRFAFVFPFPEGQPEASSGYPLRDFPAVAISPDGSELAYVTGHGETTEVFLRSVDRLEPRPLEGTTNATSPFFSPDNQWVGFSADGKLKKVSIHGGEPVTLCDPQSIAAPPGRRTIRLFSLRLSSAV